MVANAANAIAKCARRGFAALRRRRHPPCAPLLASLVDVALANDGDTPAKVDRRRRAARRPTVVAVGLSGGVDSSVAALLLQARGCRVQGLHMTNWDASDESGGAHGNVACSGEHDFDDAAQVRVYISACL